MTSSERGFTLAETMIAVAILSIMTMLTYGTFSRSLSARERAGLISEHYNQMRQASLRMSREISSAFISAHRDCTEDRTKTLFRGERHGGGMRLDFTSFSHVKMRADANESDQNELSYFIDQHPDDNTKKALFRREQARIDGEPDEGGVEQVLAEGVTDLQFEFYNLKDDDWEDTWDTERSEFEGRLPLFVRIELTADDPQGEEEKFITKTRIWTHRELIAFGLGVSRCPK